MCRCLWYARGLCLCPFVTTPRGFTSLPTQEVGYSFLGYIATNKQTNKRCNWRAGGQLCGDKTTTKKKLARSRTVGKAIRSEWICSQGFCFEPKGEESPRGNLSWHVEWSWAVLNLWYDRRKSGRAASGGAVALEPPHASRNTPKFIQNFSQNTLFFFHISDVSLHRESKTKGAQSGRYEWIYS